MTTELHTLPGKLILANGSRFDGSLVGAGALPVSGELVFNTSMTGYQEVITDPSYAGQLVAMTYPQIGNYGVSLDDSERSACAARALIVRELSPYFSPGPGRSSLIDFMSEHGLLCLTGVDTRAVTRKIRTGGAVLGIIGSAEHSDQDLLELLRGRAYSMGEALVSSVTGAAHAPRSANAQRTLKISEHSTAAHPDSTPALFSKGIRGRAALIDLGVKKSIVEHLEAIGVETVPFDMHFTVEEIVTGQYDCLVLSNGPGDPADIPEVIDKVEALLGRVPILGICLGHQVTALAMGAKTYKMKFGHRGANHPVTCQRTGRVFITSQNHGYAVSDDLERKTGAVITYLNANDGTVEGFTDPDRRIECLQFHPEASPGPHDMNYFFDAYFQKIEGCDNATVA